jgi:hypothetical protein
MENEKIESQNTTTSSSKLTKKEQKLENKRLHEQIVSSMSEVEYEQFKLEKLRYFDNKFSHGLGYVGIICSLIACFIALNTLSPSAFLSGIGVVIAILMNIFILLTGFLTVEKVKAYSIGYSRYMIGLGVFCIVRMFWYPLTTLVQYGKMMADNKSGNFTWAQLLEKYGNVLGKSLLSGKPYDAAGNVIPNDSTALIDHVSTTGYMTANYTVRGIVMIVFLGIAAFCFIYGGYVGLKKSKQLKKYLASLNKNN